MDMMLLAASFWTGPVGSIFLIVLGFGLVIFIHELGHFMVAKWVGIKVEQFAIGFGRRLIGFTRGETEYRINILPLGGYVKMLGQDDLKPADENEADPRAYNNRPVWARICVVSAGVVMNVILAAVLFVIVFAVGKRIPPPVVGDVRPGYPADQAGLKTGDRVLEINGEPISKFNQLTVTATLSDEGEQFRMLIQRPGKPEPFVLTFGTESCRSPGGAVGHAFGFGGPRDRVLRAPEALGLLADQEFKAGDKILSIDGKPVEHGWQISRIEEGLAAKPVDVSVERKNEDGESTKHTIQIRPHMDWSHTARRRHFRTDRDKAADDEAIISIKGRPFHVLGLQPRMRIWMVPPDSPAAEAGIKTGDVISAYGPTRATPTLLQFTEISKDYAGGEAPIEILRDGKVTEIERIKIRNLNGKARAGFVPMYDDDHLVVASILPDSPLEGKVLPASQITAVNGETVSTWPELIEKLTSLHEQQKKKAKLTFKKTSGKIHSEEIELATAGFSGDDYAYRLDLLQKEMREEVRAGPIDALVLGVGETGDSIVLTYATLRGFFKGRVSGKEFSGPVGIFRIGVAVGERGVIWLVWLMAIISANLAVINFLPLPIVDGGHVVMLLIEKIRRRPLSMKVQTAIQVTGLAALGVVFVLITYNDIAKWVSSKWW